MGGIALLQLTEGGESIGAKSDANKYFPDHGQSYLTSDFFALPVNAAPVAFDAYKLGWLPIVESPLDESRNRLPRSEAPRSGVLKALWWHWNIVIFNSLQTSKQALINMARIFL